VAERGDAGGSGNPGVGGSIPSQPTILLSTSITPFSPNRRNVTDACGRRVSEDFRGDSSPSRRDRRRMPSDAAARLAGGSWLEWACGDPDSPEAGRPGGGLPARDGPRLRRRDLRSSDGVLLVDAVPVLACWTGQRRVLVVRSPQVPRQTSARTRARQDTTGIGPPRETQAGYAASGGWRWRSLGDLTPRSAALVWVGQNDLAVTLPGLRMIRSEREFSAYPARKCRSV